MDLNKEQQQAVQHKSGPLLVVAGAGTGKTTVVTERIKWLIAQGLAKPEEILALTFTEKAAREMEAPAREVPGRPAWKGSSFRRAACAPSHSFLLILLPQPFPDSVVKFLEPRLEAPGGGVAGTREVDCLLEGDGRRPPRADDDAVGESHRFDEIVRDKHDRKPRFAG